MRKSLVVLLALTLGSAPLAALAQDGPPPEMRAAMAKARDDAKAQAYKALSADHKTAVDGVVADLAAKKLDMRAAATKIDGILTADEKKAVLAAMETMRTSMRPPGGGQGGPPGGGQGGPPGGGQGGPPGGGRGGPPGGGERASAGAQLLRLSLTREQMEALRPSGDRPPQR